MKHLRNVIGLICLFGFTFALTSIAHAFVDYAVPSNQKIYVDNIPKEIVAYNIDENNYFMLRDLAEMFNHTDSQFDVTWNQAQKKVVITTGKEYSSAGNGTPNNAKKEQEVDSAPVTVEIDGRTTIFYAFNIDGNNYFMLRELAGAVPFTIDYDKEKGAVNIVTGKYGNIIRTEGCDSIITIYPRYSPWSSALIEYIYSDNPSTFCVVDHANSKIAIDTYDSKTYQHKGTKYVDFELDKYGGIYAGTKYNFAVFGQENKEHAPDRTTFRVVKYSKQWERLGECNISNTYTEIPFRAGTLRMIEDRGYLYVHTAHQRYDGHQSNISFSVDIERMKKIDGHYQTQGYVSHSFDQFIAIDGDDLVTLDLGDAYPRAVVINRYNDLRGDGVFNYNMGLSKLKLLEIPGETGDNYTGVCVGGFGVGEKNYIASLKQDDECCLLIHDKRFTEELVDAKIAGVNENGGLIFDFDWDSSFLGVKRINLSDFKAGKPESYPYLVKLPDNNFMVLWQDEDGVEYVKVDETGQKLSDVKTLEGAPLTQQPFLNGDEIIWYDNVNKARVFYRIKI